MPKVEVKGLYKVFGERPERAIPKLQEGIGKEEIMEQMRLTVGVNNVTFSVDEGETFVVMGLSGSGKSTLVRCLNRLIEPTAGEVIIDEEEVVAMDDSQLRELRRKKLGMVFQRFALFPHRTVLENVEYGLEVQNVDRAQRKQRSLDILDQVGLKGWDEMFPHALSGGMQQRVGLARALANDPDILLMDEAFSALDPLIRREMQDELLALQAKMKKTVIFITHDLDEALRIGDRIALMKDGSIVQIGTPEEILIEPATEYVSQFVADVDMSKVLTADVIMKSPVATVREQDGPRVALHAMQEHGISSIFVVDRGRRLIGAVMADDAVEAVENQKTTLEGLLRTDVPQMAPETLVSDMLPQLATSDLPFAIVNDKKQLLGIVVRGAVLAGLARRGVRVKRVG